MMLTAASQQSLSPDTFTSDLKSMFSGTSSISSGYCSSPQDEPSDESFDGDKADIFSSGYQMWGANGNSEHIAHNILSQLFDDDPIKSPTPVGSVLSGDRTFGDSGLGWSNQFSKYSDDSHNDGFVNPWAAPKPMQQQQQQPTMTAPGAPLCWSTPPQQQQNQFQAPMQQQQQGGSPIFNTYQHHQPSPTSGGFNGGRVVRPLPAEMLQQSIMRRKVMEQNMLPFPDQRSYNGMSSASPNKLFPSPHSILSLSHHRKMPLSFSAQPFDYTQPHQPEMTPDSKILLSTIESCWSELLQLNREEKKYEFIATKLLKDFQKPVPQLPKAKSHVKLDLLIQNTDSTHSMIKSFIEGIEVAGRRPITQKAAILGRINTLAETCRKMVELRRQIHLVHGLGNDDTIRKLISALELYSRNTKQIRSNLYTMVSQLQMNHNNK